MTHRISELQSVQIVVESDPLLRIVLPDGLCIDYPLRYSQLLLLARQALDAAMPDT